MTYREKRLKLFNACVKYVIQSKMYTYAYKVFNDELKVEIEDDIISKLQMFVNTDDIENLNVECNCDNRGLLHIDITYD